VFYIKLKTSFKFQSFQDHPELRAAFGKQMQISTV